MRPWHTLRLWAAITIEGCPDARECEERAILIEREPDHVLFLGRWVRLGRVLSEAVGRDQAAVLGLEPAPRWSAGKKKVWPKDKLKLPRLKAALLFSGVNIRELTEPALLGILPSLQVRNAYPSNPRSHRGFDFCLAIVGRQHAQTRDD